MKIRCIAVLLGMVILAGVKPAYAQALNKKLLEDYEISGFTITKKKSAEEIQRRRAQFSSTFDFVVVEGLNAAFTAGPEKKWPFVCGIILAEYEISGKPGMPIRDEGGKILKIPNDFLNKNERLRVETVLNIYDFLFANLDFERAVYAYLWYYRDKWQEAPSE